MRRIDFEEIWLQNFKNHRNLKVLFSEITRIKGPNGAGKTSIGDAVSWVLFGCDPFGNHMSKNLSPEPTNYDYDIVGVDLTIKVEGAHYLFGRRIEKGKMLYYVNGVPRKATEYDEAVASLFDKSLFLSLFNPAYFFSQKWEEQRAQLLKNVLPPANKEVFAELKKPHADKLAELLKKHNIDDLAAKHKDNKNRQDKALIAAESRVKTLQEQLKDVPEWSEEELHVMQEGVAHMRSQMSDIEKVTDAAWETNSRIQQLEGRIERLNQDIKFSVDRWPTLKDEPIQDTCRTCKQRLEEMAVAAVQADKDKRIVEYKQNHERMIAERKELKDELATLVPVDVAEQTQKLRELDSKRQTILQNLGHAEQRRKLHTTIAEAETLVETTRNSHNESVFILDAIKASKAKEAELMAAKVKGLFKKLSLQLFLENKTDGEQKPYFEVEMDGKPYRKLSRAEGIIAGLELIDVLSELIGLIVPVFLDNAESIIRYTKPAGQLIECRVDDQQNLTISEFK